VQVVAVVAQRSEKVRRYIEDSGLPFDILVDDSRETVKAYGVWHHVGFDAWNIARPALFLIDRQGVIRYSFVASTQFEFPTHDEIVREIAEVVLIPDPRGPGTRYTGDR
jgi:peroxiredoxin